MRYILAVLSHGAPTSRYAERALRSFVGNVEPSPVVTVYLHDGPGECYTGLPEGPKEYASSGAQAGFCGATRELWQRALIAAAAYGAPFVFWLEHDFVFERRVSLPMLADVLLGKPALAQISLMRGAENAKEKRSGGVVQSFPALTFAPHPPLTEHPVWLEHDAYFTTNPSLMRTRFMLDNQWPEYEDQCEGRYGIDLRQRGYRFAVWGDGAPWVRHIGTRDGKGY